MFLLIPLTGSFLKVLCVALRRPTCVAMVEERTGGMDAAHLPGLSSCIRYRGLDNLQSTIEQYAFLPPPLMLVSVDDDALSCVAAWQLMTGALRKIRVEKISKTCVCLLWCERDG